METPQSARAWLDHLLEPGWTPLFEEVVSNDPIEFPGYKEQLEEARARTGASESVLVGEGTIETDGASSRLVVVAFEFGFLGGSMGVAAGERICRAFERAADTKVPLLALVATGGARMQEGMAALARMPATMQARARVAEAGRPFIAFCGHPTTGGVYVSFASSADLILADPDATIGFAGPRVVEAVTGAPLPPGSHTGLDAYRAGLVDQLVVPAHLKSTLSYALDCLDRDRDRAAGPGAAFTMGAGVGNVATEVVARAWQAIAITTRGQRILPQGYRDARRAIGIASRLGLPVVTLIDTPGADPSPESERAGIAREISMTYDALLRAPVPTVAVVTGEGGSGGALALACCDRVLMLETATFDVISPAAASSILKRADVDVVASDLRRGARDLAALGIVDTVVSEPDGWTRSDDALPFVDDPIAAAIAGIARGGGAPTQARTARWRSAGR